MTKRDNFCAALERKPIKGLVPHFELVFYLTMESIGKVHPLHRSFSQWNQMSRKEKDLQRTDIAETYIKIAEKYNHSAIFVHSDSYNPDEAIEILTKIREISGNEYFLVMHADATMGIPDGDNMEELIYRIADEPDKLHEELNRNVETLSEKINKIAQHKNLLDGVALCCDYCFNVGPFLSPSQFSVFVAPYLQKEIENYRNMGLYTIKHTDGNIMPIIDQIVQCNPHALHSLDPQAGVDIKEVKKLYGDKTCLIGNVNCGLLQTGTAEQVIESARYSLQNGMPGGGYIFSTSNCVYTGMDLERYELILDVWNREGIYE